MVSLQPPWFGLEDVRLHNGQSKSSSSLFQVGKKLVAEAWSHADFLAFAPSRGPKGGTRVHRVQAFCISLASRGTLS